MRNQITKIATAAVIILVALLILNYTGSSLGPSALAKVADNIEKAKTLSWQVTTQYGGKEPQTREFQIREPYHMRIEFDNGTTEIIDYEQNLALIMNQNNKVAMQTTIDNINEEFEDFLKDFRNLTDSAVIKIGSREIIAFAGFDQHIQRHH